MTKTILAAAFTVLVAGIAQADPVDGVWKTQPGDDGNYGHVRFQDCDGTVCGYLVAGFNSAGEQIGGPNIGKAMVWGMSDQGGGKYGGGKVWAPDRDKTYNGKMQLSGNSLKVQGCVAVVCRGQTWTRVQ